MVFEDIVVPHRLAFMNSKQLLNRIQKLSNLYVDRSIESCEARFSVMYELKDHVRTLLHFPACSEHFNVLVEGLQPQLASLAAHLNPSLIEKNTFRRYLIVGGVGRSGTTAFGNSLNKLLILCKFISF